MSEFVSNLPDGWTIYVWMVMAVVILVGAAIFLRWAIKNSQFDEDIKYVVFDENDKDKMDKNEYEKSRRVMASQEELRENVLEARAEERAKKNAKG